MAHARLAQDPGKTVQESNFLVSSQNWWLQKTLGERLKKRCLAPLKKPKIACLTPVAGCQKWPKKSRNKALLFAQRVGMLADIV